MISKKDTQMLYGVYGLTNTKDPTKTQSLTQISFSLDWLSSSSLIEAWQVKIQGIFEGERYLPWLSSSSPST